MAKQENSAGVQEGEVIESPAPRTNAKSKEVVKKPINSVVAGIAISTTELKKALDSQTEQRKLIADFIKKHLKADVDYLRIHVVRNCQAEDNRRGSCGNEHHFSKNILAKPGQEKIFSLFQLSSELIKDEETIEMLDGMKNLVAYKCIVKRGKDVIAEGRGAAVVGDNRRDVNATIKIAEKRARMDACLSLGFSEYFAQDLDDPDYQVQKRAAEDQAAARAESNPTGLPARPANAPIDDQERQLLAKLMIKAGFDSKEEQLELLRLNGVTNPAGMTSGVARGMINKLKTSAFARPTKGADPVIEDIPDGPITLDDVKFDEPEKPAEPAEPPLEVDDELKAAVTERLTSLGLNARGEMWFKKKASGRPFGNMESWSDDNWRQAYELVMLILDNKLEVPDEYIAGVVIEPGEEKEEDENVKPSKPSK